MNFNHLVAVEREIGRIHRAVRNLASDPKALKAMQDAEQILAEVRFASQFLCDPALDDPEHEAATERLVQTIFTTT